MIILKGYGITNGRWQGCNHITYYYLMDLPCCKHFDSCWQQMALGVALGLRVGAWASTVDSDHYCSWTWSIGFRLQHQMARFHCFATKFLWMWGAWSCCWSCRWCWTLTTAVGSSRQPTSNPLLIWRFRYREMNQRFFPGLVAHPLCIDQEGRVQWHSGSFLA